MGVVLKEAESTKSDYSERIKKIYDRIYPEFWNIPEIRLNNGIFFFDYQVKRDGRGARENHTHYGINKERQFIKRIREPGKMFQDYRLTDAQVTEEITIANIKLDKLETILNQRL